MTKEEALNEFLQAFEGRNGNRDGQVTLREWTEYYEEVSASIDSDDYFGDMMVKVWAHLKRKNADGSRSPALTYAASADVERLQRELKASIYQKSTSSNQQLVAEQAFKQFDYDGSGSVSMSEFITALERFGLLIVDPKDKCPGGWPREVVVALFSRFDADGSGSLDYKEFAGALYRDEREPAAAPQMDPALRQALRNLQGALDEGFVSRSEFDDRRRALLDGATRVGARELRNAETGRLIGKPCFKGNEWLKGSNQIFNHNR